MSQLPQYQKKKVLHQKNKIMNLHNNTQSDKSYTSDYIVDNTRRNINNLFVNVTEQNLCQEHGQDFTCCYDRKQLP